MKRNKLRITVVILCMILVAAGGILCTASTSHAWNSNIDAAYGTDNTASYWPANGTGGTVEFYAHTCVRRLLGICYQWQDWVTMSSGNNSSVSPASSSPRFRVTPDSGYRIKFIKYAEEASSWGGAIGAGNWIDISVSDPSASNDFTLSNIQTTYHNYVLWVCFEAIAPNYTVTASVFQDATPTTCQANSYITQIGSVTGNAVYTLNTAVASGSTTSVRYSAGSGCEVEDVLFNGNSVGVQASPYTTPAITSTSTVVVKFRPVSYIITSSIDPASPGYVSSTGLAASGTVSPLGATSVPRTGSQTFTITPATNYRILNVRVTDANAGYNNTDLGAITNQYGTFYTFNNVTASGSIIVTFASDSTTSNTYCQTPPFISSQTSLKPNVLIIFDNSGSMADLAYNVSNASYSPSKDYYGYYDNTKMYKITSSTVHNINAAGLNKAAACSSQTVGSICSGNELNFRNMRKVDVIRKILMGGKVANRSASTIYLLTNNGKNIEYGASLPSGIVQAMDAKVRFGLMVFNPNNNYVGAGDGGRIVSQVGTPAASLITVMEGADTDPGGNTPLAESYYEAIRYFEAQTSAYNSGVDYGTMDPIQYSCQKNFVLLITDGQPTADFNIPGYSDSSTRTVATVTDSDYTTWQAAANTKSLKPTTGLLPWVAYYAHVNDLRSATVGKSAILGKQNLTLYTIYTFGDGSGTAILKEAAKFGGFKDSDDLTSAGYLLPDKLKEYHALGTSDAPNTDPDNYFEASEGDVLETSIQQAMANILSDISSGTAASILSSSQGSGANLVQAMFYPSKTFKDSAEVKWTGEMQNLWYYVDPFLSQSSIREDTDYVASSAYHLLNLKQDYTVSLYFDSSADVSKTLAELKQDTNGDGSGDTLIGTSLDPDSIKSIWRAGKLLWARTADSRTIHTSIDGQSLAYYPAETPIKGGFASATTRATALTPYLQTADLTETQKLINYIRGADQPGYRNRKVTFPGTDTPTEWKLGDIISSTPSLQSNTRLQSYDLGSPAGYNDKSYAAFISTSAYQNRGMVYVGANDGMLHAFKLGKLTVAGTTDVLKSNSNNCGGVTPPSGYYCVIKDDLKATLTGTGLGDEQWAYVPQHVLPYLKYYADQNNYNHLYYVDGPTVLVDASIAKPSTCAVSDDYSNCVKDTTGGTNWRTILIGSMGLGGASRLKGNSCTNGSGGTCVKTPIYDPTDTATTKTKGIGYSSYFALDITGQTFDSSGNLATQPTLKWEFSHPELGFATSGAAIVRISAKNTSSDPSNPTNTVSTSDNTKNGKFFAVFASGPTGPIDEVAHQFLGRSDQNLKLFVVDLGATGALTLNTNYWIIDTGIKRAFGGSMLNAAIDTDRWKSRLQGNYQDDALYVGYTKANIDDSSPITSTTEWTSGGVIRLITGEDVNPAHWKTSTVLSGVGPVTSSIARLQDRKNHKLWLYFGSGRSFYGGDDPSNRRYIVGVSDPCYKINDALDKACADSPPTALTLSDLKQQDTIGTLTTEKGWYITLDAQSTAANLGAERSITTPVALTNGLVVFTTFKPTSDVCSFGGNTYLWATKYDTGGLPPSASLDSKVVLQLSTGAFEEKRLGDALIDGGRKTAAMVGQPPPPPPVIITNASNKPIKKIMQFQEK